jgi:hypothetical protein
VGVERTPHSRKATSTVEYSSRRNVVSSAWRCTCASKDRAASLPNRWASQRWRTTPYSVGCSPARAENSDGVTPTRGGRHTASCPKRDTPSKQKDTLVSLAALRSLAAVRRAASPWLPPCYAAVCIDVSKRGFHSRTCRQGPCSNWLEIGVAAFGQEEIDERGTVTWLTIGVTQYVRSAYSSEMRFSVHGDPIGVRRHAVIAG